MSGPPQGVREHSVSAWFAVLCVFLVYANSTCQHQCLSQLHRGNAQLDRYDMHLWKQCGCFQPVYPRSGFITVHSQVQI